MRATILSTLEVAITAALETAEREREALAEAIHQHNEQAHGTAADAE